MNKCVTNHVSNALWLGVYQNWLLDKICISYTCTNVDIIYYCIREQSNHNQCDKIMYCHTS